MISLLLALAAIFAELSILAFGGGNSILPEMQRQVVEVHHWMTAQEFTAYFALAQAAPGPNMMVVTLIGWHVAGFPGVLVTSLAKFGPSSVLTGIVTRLWDRFKDKPWRQRIQTSLTPVTIGLVTSSAVLITEASDSNVGLYAITALVLLGSFLTRLHPLWLLAAGSLLGLTGIGQG